MKNKISLILFILLLLKVNAYSQNSLAENKGIKTLGGSADTYMVKESNITPQKVIEFDVYSAKSAIETENSEDHFLGKEIAIKYSQFNNLYTYKVAISPGNPAMRTMFRKPVIYESVHKVEKFVKKGLKNGSYTMEEASSILGKVLEIANNAIYCNTDELERRIRDEKNPEGLIVFYKEFVQLNYIN